MFLTFLINMYLKIGILILVLSISFGSGYKVRSLMAEAAKSARLKADKLKLEQNIEINDKLRIQLANAKAITNTVYETIIKEIPVYVTKIQKVDSGCNITYGTQQLLNNAVNYLPQSSGGITYPNTKATGIKEIDLINYTAKIITRYNEARDQCNLLIAWHKSELF